MTHACLDCEFKNFGFPCRKDGIVDFEALAEHYLREFCQPKTREETLGTEQHWSFGCVDDLTREDPETGWRFVLAAIRRLKTANQAGLFAAGPPEDLIARHGATFIDRVEAEARRSPRFRFVLTGVWPLGNEDTPVWKRIEALQTVGPKLDDGDPLPEV